MTSTRLNTRCLDEMDFSIPKAPFIKIMTEERLIEITRRYNSERHLFSFPTVESSKEGIKSILDMDKNLEKLSDDKLIFKIAVFINDLAFGWN